MIAKHLNIKEDVTSPSFNIKNEYKINETNKLIHIDLYRLGDNAIEMFQEIIHDDLENNIVIVE
jgi:tRNA A37 threonylcarbamoyladenosine biosynthesis protein TsaE